MAAEKKAEVRVFLDGAYIKIIDDLLGTGYGTNRSEVIRTIVHDWVVEKLGVEKMIKYKKKGSG